MDLRFISLFGLVAFIGFAWVISTDRKRFPWPTVLAGVALQFFLALIILKTKIGQKLFAAAGDAISRLIDFSQEGARFVFGPLANFDALKKGLSVESGMVFFVMVMATIVFVSSLSSLLYHYGILQRVVRMFAWVMQRLMGTSGSESLCAAANIFMGQTEAPLVIRPYLPRMTRSELMAVMVGGMATIAGGVLAVYSKLGEDAGFKGMAGHLLTASVLSAPAALVISKILVPETEKSETAAGAPAQIERESHNGLDALCRGASDGMTLSLNVFAMLIAFIALVALCNFLLAAVLHWVNVPGDKPLQMILGWLNAPVAWLIGVPGKDCVQIGGLLGERMVLNEFVAYISLTEQAKSLDPRSVTLTTYALCGFANFASIAIQIGGIGALVPGRRKDLASLGLRAMIGGLIACYMTACIAGILL
ncbi:MAG: Na+ dependent nucleoside transporter domain protein [Pedosphaera sp.]|nr:Na+ dependent nucleoside transporter domain protein [Pedosphaera sp.]